MRSEDAPSASLNARVDAKRWAGFFDSAFMIADFDLRIESGNARDQTVGLLIDLRLHQIVFAVRGKRRRAGEHLVEHDGEAVEIASLVAFLAAQLLGRHVGERADNAAAAGEPLAAADAGDAEVHDLEHAVFRDHQVRRFDVAVDHAHAMGVSQPVGGLGNDGEAFAHVERRIALGQYVVERVAAHQLHDHVEIFAVGDERVERGDVGVIEPGEARRLGAEAVDEIGVAEQFGTQRLHRHFALQHGVERGVDLPDAALAEQVANLVLADQLRHRDSELVLGLPPPPIGSLMRRVVGSTRFGAAPVVTLKTPSEALSSPPAASAASIKASHASCGGRREATSAIFSSGTMLLTPSEQRIKTSPTCSGRPLAPIIGLMLDVVPSACRMTLCIGLWLASSCVRVPSLTSLATSVWSSLSWVRRRSRSR